MSSKVLVPISVGELYDKISILEIKSERLTDPAKLGNVNYEMRLLNDIAKESEYAEQEKIKGLFLKLKEVNTNIWEAEDTIRDCERRGAFGEGFLDTARSIYRLNDARAAVKREISVLTSSAVIEEKSYSGY
jgi:hypothetical protein